MANSGDFIFRAMIREWRFAELGLARRPEKRFRPVATLYAYSPQVVPKPSDWGESVFVTGYWFLDDHSGWSPSTELKAFLSAGVPPVYVGFGSMPGLDPVRTTSIFVEALKRAGKRGVFATGGGALAKPLAPHTFTLDQAPHDKLFPLMAACVHHGGAGTTAAALRAGKPSVVCPFFGDQPFWARRISEIGAGPPPLNRRTLTVDAVTAAIVSATSNPTIGQSAATLGLAIAAEHGVNSAVAVLTSLLRKQ